MLNENHAFILDFPELKLDIVQLNHDNPKFKADLQQYHVLDYDIRQLEISDSPIDDQNMQTLKTATRRTQRYAIQTAHSASPTSRPLI
ncbi:hypothetical protein VIBRN418_10878 [Vibrio sp. N418]|nr:hypothetical protein VIBRN418_10878 [Vibrio sp. N418]